MKGKCLICSGYGRLFGTKERLRICEKCYDTGVYNRAIRKFYLECIKCGEDTSKSQLKEFPICFDCQSRNVNKIIA